MEVCDKNVQVPMEARDIGSPEAGGIDSQKPLPWVGRTELESSGRRASALNC